MTTIVAIRYVGPVDAVEIGGIGVVKRGDVIECGATLAATLLEQTTNFETVEEK